ncbi:protein MMS22-like [Diachasma alloeum]|uniref:protein MMS22-like n=1 Tax=Diachasma alloeum TaxID=454923 RepID=UPI0007382F96|nr:protein MMS22-like [Diachasma alloeum]
MEETTFSCSGKVTPTDPHLPPSSLVHRPHLNPILHPPSLPTFPSSTPILFGSPHPAATAIIQLKHLIKLMEMNMRILNRHENPQELPQPHEPHTQSQMNYYHLRKEILDFVVYIRSYFHSIQSQLPYLQHPLVTELKTGFDEVLFSLGKFLSRLKNISLHYSSSGSGNRCPQPGFHLFHLHLELRWMMITLVHQQTLQDQSQDQNDRLDRALELFVQDLIFVSMKTFQRIDSSDLLLKTPFSCSCVRDLWLTLQITIPKIPQNLGNRTFWSYVNSTLDRIIQSNEEGLSWNKADKCPYKLDTKSPEIFCIWMIYHLTLLHTYPPEGSYPGSPILHESNCHQLEKILKSFLDKGGKEGERDEIDEELRIMIPLLKMMILEFWKDKDSSVRIISYLWDCFHRRLDQPFLVQTAGPWSVSLEKKSPRDILKQVRERINGENPKESSFGMFLKLLGIILKENYEKREVKVWNQIRGRVYSKFSKSKVKEFSEVRLFNLISLLLTLGVTADADNVVKVMMGLLPSPLEGDEENGRRVSLSFKGQLCGVALLLENRLDLRGIGEEMMSVVGVLSTRRDDLGRGMMSVFVETLRESFDKVDLLDNGEHHLIGGWIDRYLLECPKNRAGTMLKMLFDLLNKSRALDLQNLGGKEMLEALWASAAARIRALVYDNDLTEENCEDIGKLAAAFTLEALRCPKMAEGQKHSAPSLFRHFTSTIYVKDVNISRIYLSIILENRAAIGEMKKILDNFDHLVMQVWLKCAISNMDPSTKTIKSYLVDVDPIRKLFPSWRDSLDFKTSNTSLLLFLNTLSTYRSSLTPSELPPLDKQIKTIFLTLDKWVLSPVKPTTEDSPTSLFIYRCLGTIILTCAPILYTPTPTNPLRVLITKIMLPAEDNSHLKLLGKKIFSMIVLGLQTLSPKQDQILQKIVVELFNVYLPLLITEHDRSFRIEQLINLFNKEISDDFVEVIFDKLSSNYLTIENNELRKNSYLFMELMKGLLREGGRRALVEVIGGKVLKLVIEGFLRVHDLHPHRRQTFELIKELCGNAFYSPEGIKGSLCAVVCGRVREMTKGCFEFLRGLAGVDRGLVQGVVDALEGVVGDAERGGMVYVGALRYALKQFMQFLGRGVGQGENFKL